MDTSQHDLNALFTQLGLPDSDAEMWRFIREHASLRRDQRIEQAEFWTPSQAAFLRDALADDSDWAEVVDELDALLRPQPH